MTKSFLYPFVTKVVQRLQSYKMYHCDLTVIFHMKPLSLHQTCKADAFIDPTKQTNEGLNKILTLRKQPYLLRLQPVRAAKFVRTPK